MTLHECERCGQRLYRAPDGSWVNDSEDVVCAYDDPEKPRHVPVEVDDDQPVPRGTQITTAGDGVIEGWSDARPNQRVRKLVLFYAEPAVGETTRVVYLGTAEATRRDGRAAWRVRGVGDWSYVDVTAGLGEGVRDAVKLLYTAHEVSQLDTTETEREGEN